MADVVLVLAAAAQVFQLNQTGGGDDGDGAEVGRDLAAGIPGELGQWRDEQEVQQHEICTGSFEQAVVESGRVLAVRGRDAVLHQYQGGRPVRRVSQ